VNIDILMYPFPVLALRSLYSLASWAYCLSMLENLVICSPKLKFSTSPLFLHFNKILYIVGKLRAFCLHFWKRFTTREIIIMINVSKGPWLKAHDVYLLDVTEEKFGSFFANCYRNVTDHKCACFGLFWLIGC
jgi:hypothetical protein